MRAGGRVIELAALVNCDWVWVRKLARVSHGRPPRLASAAHKAIVWSRAWHSLDLLRRRRFLGIPIFEQVEWWRKVIADPYQRAVCLVLPGCAP